MSKLTEYEQDRIKGIRATLRKFKSQGEDVSYWEATFFLAIVDRLLEQK